jgi:hypothetical protein
LGLVKVSLLEVQELRNIPLAAATAIMVNEVFIKLDLGCIKNAIQHLLLHLLPINNQKNVEIL